MADYTGVVQRPIYPIPEEEYDRSVLVQLIEVLRLRDQINPNIPISVGWTMTNKTSDRVLDADSTTLAEVADVLATLIDDLKTAGYLG